MKFHTIKLQILALTVSSAFMLTFCSSSLSVQDPITEQQKTILKNVRRILALRHYQPQEYDDTYSEKVYKLYMESIDPDKLYFTQQDIALFDKHKDLLDDDINNLDLTFFNATIDTLNKRVTFVKNNFSKLLDKPYDYTVEEEYIIDDADRKYATDTNDLLNQWRKRMKYNVLYDVYNGLDNQNEKKATSDTIVEIKTFDKLEQEAREELKENNSDYFRRILLRDKKDFFEVFINSYTDVFDPHTTYFSPKSQDEFNFAISGKMEGIGAVIQDKKGYPTIKEMLIGSPSWKTGKIKVGDKILKVTQEDGTSVNIVGMKLDDAVLMIRGKKGTKVILTLEREDGSKIDVPIIRDVIENDATYAKSMIIGNDSQGKYGLIHLPDFYFDPNDRKGRNCSTDFYKELTELKKENIQGLVIDLRGNGGGSLQSVVEIAGMFIDKGPIVQVQSQSGTKSVLNDKDPSIVYDGNVVVLVDEFSASASEILAAALQDYHRAIIMGSKQTYGKGTVQTIFPVDFFGKEDLGGLKLTIQKFYRINGGSTQLEGVYSDIVFPNIYQYTYNGERDEKTALNFDKINTLVYNPWYKKINLQKIEDSSNKRIKENVYFKSVEENAEWFRQQKNRKSVSLQLDTYSKMRNEQNIKSKEFEKLYGTYKNSLSFSDPLHIQTELKSDTIVLEKRKKWHETLQKDAELQEAINVLKDINGK